MKKPRTTKRLQGSTYLTPEEFVELAASVLGGYGWKKRLTALVACHPGSVTRWCSGDSLVPKWLAVLLYTLKHTPQSEIAALMRAVPTSGQRSGSPPDTTDVDL